MSDSSGGGSLPQIGSSNAATDVGKDVLVNGKGLSLSEKVTEGPQENLVVKDLKTNVAESKKEGGSWSGVVQGSPRMKRYDFTVEDVNGVETIRVPKEVLENSPPLWDDLLVGKFLDTAPFVGKIHVLVNKIWTLGDKTKRIDVFVVDKTTVKFRIKDAIIRNRVLKRRTWNLCEVPMIVSRWSPVEEEKQPEMTSVPLWVIVKGVVPRPMFAWKGLSFLTSPIGKPKSLHADTELCKSFEVARVFVEADLTKALPKSRTFDMEGEFIKVEYEYPWLPARCEDCGKWGHKSEACVMKVKSGTGSSPNSPKKSSSGSQNVSKQQQHVAGEKQSTDSTKKQSEGPSLERTVKLNEGNGPGNSISTPGAVENKNQDHAFVSPCDNVIIPHIS